MHATYTSTHFHRLLQKEGKLNPIVTDYNLIRAKKDLLKRLKKYGSAPIGASSFEQHHFEAFINIHMRVSTGIFRCRMTCVLPLFVCCLQNYAAFHASDPMRAIKSLRIAAILAVSWASGKRASNLGQLRLAGLTVAVAKCDDNPHGYIYSLYLGVEKNRQSALQIKPEVSVSVLLFYLYIRCVAFPFVDPFAGRRPRANHAARHVGLQRNCA